MKGRSMNINGLQKMTLLDYPGKVACTVFLSGCDFRCPFCHNSELLNPNAETVMTEEELLDFLKKRAGLLEAVCLTGGEPTLRKDLLRFISLIRGLGYKVKLDTNGFNPDALSRLIEEGLLNYVAMDIKNSPKRYAETVGLPKIDTHVIGRSIQILMNGSADYEFRTTVVDELHCEDDFRRIGEWIHGAKRYYLQAFADRTTVPYAGFHAPVKEKMLKYSRIMGEYVHEVGIRGVDL